MLGKEGHVWVEDGNYTILEVYMSNQNPVPDWPYKMSMSQNSPWLSRRQFAVAGMTL